MRPTLPFGRVTVRAGCTLPARWPLRLAGARLLGSCLTVPTQSLPPAARCMRVEQRMWYAHVPVACMSLRRLLVSLTLPAALAVRKGGRRHEQVGRGVNAEGDVFKFRAALRCYGGAVPREGLLSGSLKGDGLLVALAVAACDAMPLLVQSCRPAHSCPIQADEQVIHESCTRMWPPRLAAPSTTAAGGAGHVANTFWIAQLEPVKPAKHWHSPSTWLHTPRLEHSTWHKLPGSAPFTPVQSVSFTFVMGSSPPGHRSASSN